MIAPNVPRLLVEFAGEHRCVDPGDELTFGRSADLEIDDNRFLHRILGRFSCNEGTWWVHNVGRAIPLTVADARSPSFAKLTPGASMPLSFADARVSFEAGGAAYELCVEMEGMMGRDSEDDAVDDGTDFEATHTASSLPLSDEQRLLLVALAEPKLRDPARDVELPTNRQLASSLGWTITKFNRKLDGLCRKYAAAGVKGLHGSSGELAKDRRGRLVEHVIHSRVISDEDLALLGDLSP
ncbi:MAG: hypothetical protein M3Q72_14450 [Actinomycetota bacterium]|nr:hypothetical protein [Actinomycetota bacterium]